MASLSPDTLSYPAELESRGVPLLDLKRQHGPLHEEMVAALAGVCESGAFVLGPEVRKLEERMEEYCGASHAIACASGSEALLLALMAIGVEKGSEVILPSFTFFATASAVTRLGARPVFADIDPKTFNIDPASVESLLTSSTKAIIPVHLFGQCVEMDEIRRIAEAIGAVVIEDAAQAIGAEYKGRRAGSMGEIGCFSYYPTKNLGATGDGGMVTTNSDALADSLSLLRTHGMRPRYYHEVVGINSRLDAFQAAVLNVKFAHLDKWTEMRQANAARYTEMFTDAGLDQVMGLPEAAPERRHVWNQYTVRVPDGNRDALREFLQESKIGAEIYYPMGLHEQACFQYLGYAKGDLPETDRATAEVLALPIFPELTTDEQAFLVSRTVKFFAEHAGAKGNGRSGVLKYAG